MFKSIVLLAFVQVLATAESTRDQRLQQDLNAFATELPALHVNAFHSITQAQFNQAVSNLSTSIPSITDQQFYTGLAAITAMIGDSHTAMYLINDGYFQSTVVAQLGFQNFPIRLRWLDDGVFVEAAAPQYAQTLGTQLVALGQTSTSDAVTALAAIISHENDQWLHFMAQHYLTGQQVLQALGVLPAGVTSQLTFQKRDGSQFTVSMTGAPPATLASYFDQTPGFLQDYLQSTDLNYWYSYLPSTRTMYFKYNLCRDMVNLTFAAFAQNLLAAMDQSPINTFVMDLRGNAGGSSTLVEPLLAGLNQRLSSLLANPAFQFYGAIDKGTFSSGMQDAAILKEQIPGVDLSNVVHLIGEPTGGKPASYGEVDTFTLPNSGLTVNYSTVYFPAQSVPDLPSIMPDVAISTVSSDFFARHDPVLAAIFARAAVPPPPSGDVITVSAASFRAAQGLAPGSIAAAFGTFPNGADELDLNSQSTQLFAATTSAVIFLIPDSASLGPATITVKLKGSTVAQGSATLTATSPGLFILNGVDPSQPGAVENPDYSINSQSIPAATGGFLQIYATGAGTGSATLSVYLGDVAIPVLFSGIVAPGLWLVDAKVPDTFLYQGQIPLAVALGGILSNGATVWISPK